MRDILDRLQNQMKYLHIAAALVFAACATPPQATSAPTVANASSNPYLRRVLREEFTLVDRTNAIDKNVFATLRRSIRGDSRIAEPGQPFQSTDVVSGERLPWRRLAFAGHNPNLWIVCCEHGGYAYHHDLFVFAEQSGQWKLVFVGQGFVKENSLTGLRSALKEGRFFSSSETD